MLASLVRFSIRVRGLVMAAALLLVKELRSDRELRLCGL